MMVKAAPKTGIHPTPLPLHDLRGAAHVHAAPKISLYAGDWMLAVRFTTLAVLTSVALAAAPTLARAQTPLAPLSPSGQTATPAFEGWYKNADGTYSLSFGYYNRNATEVLNIPLGPDNFVSPGNPDQGQPTYFYPRVIGACSP
jgi:hypothetical protein